MSDQTPAAKRPIDICERCKFSAYVDEGHSWFDSPQKKDLPEWHFVCRKCWTN